MKRSQYYEKVKMNILALGADIKNKFLLANGKRLSFGPEIGDLSDAKNYESLKKEVSKAIKNKKLDIIAHDLHPGYFSSRLAGELKDQFPSSKLHAVQHHHAHIASILAEHKLKKGVLGVAFDGTGFGEDSNIWGGEFIFAKGSNFRRLAHLKYVMMPGGERIVHEPWRMVLSILGKEGAAFIKDVSSEEKKLILKMVDKGINSPLTSSAGRLFDAAAALLGVCTKASYEAEGPIRLEKICKEGEDGTYPFNLVTKKDMSIIDTAPIFKHMAKDLKNKKPKAIMATKFHNSIADIIIKVVKRLSNKFKTKDVVLSGGVFQNQFLTKKVVEGLGSLRFNVLMNKSTPNDNNIALGQYYVSCNSCKD
ncbi:MAG: carbamoyltransferase HypF [Candidatus Omnitrophica bacterium]|nr:carbamoyltransferase HypF [Candidatus Omnitrophota bacterium]